MDNKIDYYLSKIERQLDFHRGLHLFEMEMDSNFTNKVVFLKESQEEYMTNLFGDNKNIRESYNRKFNNVIVESTFNPKDEVKKFFSFLKENYINEINKTNKTNLIKEEINEGVFNFVDGWSKKYMEYIKNYYKILYNQLKSGGIGVKWQVENDPEKSKFMYWGPWVIWKDEKKNGGWPISFTSTDNKVWLFKFFNNTDNKRIESKFIEPKFNLIDWGKITAANATKQLNKLIISNPKVVVPKATAQDLQIGQKVFNELKYAFDGWGTYENEAVIAFNKIKNKFQLTELNRLVKARGYFSTVYAWLQDEMSDYDYKQYRAIWDRLKSLDKTIVVPKVNNTLRVASVVGDVTGVNAVVAAGEKVGEVIKAGFTWLKDKGIPWFMEKLRAALISTGGAVVQQLLNFTGVGAIGTTVLWAVLTLFDVSQIASGAGTWAKLIFSVLGLLTAGALAQKIGGFLKPLFKSGGGTLTTFFQKIAQQNWFITYIKPVVGWIGGKLSGAAGLLKQAGDWVVKKLGATTIGGVVTKAVQWLKSIAENIVKFAGFESKQASAYLVKKDLQKQGNKLIAKAVTDPLKDKTKEKVIQGSEYVGGTKLKTAAELTYGIKDLKGASTDLNSAIKDGDILKTAETAVNTYDKFGNVIDKGTQVVINEPKKVEVPVG